MPRFAKRLMPTGLIAALALLAAGVPEARAAFVTFSTTGAFTPGTGATAIANGVEFTNGGNTVDITYTPSNGSVNSPSIVNLGTFTVTATNAAPLVDIPTSPMATQFALTVNQTTPGVGNGMFTSTLSGSISSNSGGLDVAFDNTNLTIAGITYDLRNLTNNTTLQLSNPATGGGMTSVNANITAVPEPASIALIGMGGVGALAVLRRRKPALA